MSRHGRPMVRNPGLFSLLVHLILDFHLRHERPAGIPHRTGAGGDAGTAVRTGMMMRLVPVVVRDAPIRDVLRQHQAVAIAVGGRRRDGQQRVLAGGARVVVVVVASAAPAAAARCFAMRGRNAAPAGEGWWTDGGDRFVATAGIIVVARGWPGALILRLLLRVARIVQGDAVMVVRRWLVLLAHWPAAQQSDVSHRRRIAGRTLRMVVMMSTTDLLLQFIVVDVV